MSGSTGCQTTIMRDLKLEMRDRVAEMEQPLEGGIIKI